MRNANHADFRAINAIEGMLSPFVCKKQYDVLFALQKHGVDLVHSLSAAVYAGRHEQVQWLIDQGVKPNARVLRLAITKGRPMTARILPHVEKIEPEHADVAATNGHLDLLERFMDAGVYPTEWAYWMIGKYTTPLRAQSVELMMSKGQPWRVGTFALLQLMPLLTAQQVAHAISVAPARFDREKLLACSLRAGSDAVVQEIANYGFGTKVTAKVALRAAREKNPLNNKILNKTVRRLAALHASSASAPLPSNALVRVVSRLVRHHFTTFWHSLDANGEQRNDFLQTVSALLETSHASQRAEVLSLCKAQFLIDYTSSPEAKAMHHTQLNAMGVMRALDRFKDDFEAFVQAEQRKAAAFDYSSDEPIFGGP